jgi:predicted dehydrogenase
MSCSKIVIGLIGVGGHGRSQAESFSALEREGMVHVAGLADPSTEALSLSSKLFVSAKSHTEYRHLLEDERIDAVIISAPIPFHEEMIREAMKRNLFVLTEKPAVPLVSQLINLLAEEGADRVAVGFQWVATRPMNLFKKLIWEGKLGRLRSLQTFAIWPRSFQYYQRAFWSGKMFCNGRPVFDGPATNALSHWVNNLMYLAGESHAGYGVPLEVSGEAYRANESLETYDTAFLAGRFAGGTTFRAAFTHASTETVSAELRAEGDKGRVTLNESGILSSDDIQLPDHEYSVGSEALHRNFLDFVTGKISRPLVTLRDVMGYTLSTNLMFQASGGIRQIPAEHCRKVLGSNGDFFVHLQRGEELLRRASNEGQGLRAAGASWGIPLKTLSAAEYDEAAMLSHLVKGIRTYDIE